MLTESERMALAAIEQHERAADPALAHRLTRPPASWPYWVAVVAGVTVFSVAVVFNTASLGGAALAATIYGVFGLVPIAPYRCDR